MSASQDPVRLATTVYPPMSWLGVPSRAFSARTAWAFARGSRASPTEDRRVLVQDDEVPAQGRDHEIEVHLDELLRRRSDVHLDQDLEPQAEAARVEVFFLAGPAASPQVVVEHAHQLLGGGECQDLATVLEPAGTDELVQERGLETRDELGEVGSVQEAIEKMARRSRLDGPLGHENDPPAGESTTEPIG